MTKREAVDWTVWVTWWCAVGWYTNDDEMYEFFQAWVYDLRSQF